MNIFVLDYNPKKAAEYHCDKHVVKMILETAQLLCGVHWSINSEAPYKLTHKNHPCSIWARNCIENYIWLTDLGMELCKEYTRRYNKKHKCQSIIEWCIINLPNLKENGDLTEFSLAMPDECKTNDTVQSYRNYYIKYKKDFAKWNYSTTPKWFNKS
jgi:hypothetical protein